MFRTTRALLVLSFSTLSLCDSRFMTTEYVDKFYIKMWGDHKRVEHLSFEGEGKVGSEDFYRMHVFKENLHTVYDLTIANEGSTFGFSAFTSATDEEFQENRFPSSFKKYPEITKNIRIATSDDILLYNKDANLKKMPESFSLHDTFSISHVKQGGKCSISPLYAVVGAIEGAFATPKREGPYSLIPLSEQFVLSCVIKKNELCTCQDHSTCPPERIISHLVSENSGIPKEGKYLFESEKGVIPECDTTKQAKVVVKELLSLPNEVDFLKNWLQHRGPFISTFSNISEWKLYQNGVIRSTCKDTDSETEKSKKSEITALVTGYGIYKDTFYWEVKMPWGGTFGVHGYVKVSESCLKNLWAVTVDAAEGSEEEVDPVWDDEDEMEKKEEL